MISPEEIGIQALKNAFQVYTSLGENGKESLSKNQFGDTAMKGDYEAEEAVLAVLKQNNFPVIVHSEEHGIVEVSQQASYLAVLDGIDGSSWYKSEWGRGRYATMFGIYNGLNPQYKDYVFGGIMEHATKKLFYAEKNKGAHILHIETGVIEKIRSSGIETFDRNTRIHIDQFWEINNKIFTSKLDNYNVLEYKLCSAYHYSDNAMGKSDLTLECTRKGNLEIAAAYPLIMESGGAIVSIQGDNLSDKYYLEFGQEAHMPIITASTQALADKAVDFFT